MLSIPVRTVFLNHAFFHFDFLTPNIWQSDDVVRFRKRREVWLRASPKHTLTKDKDSPRCVQCNLRAVGQPMLLDNGWLSNTATVRGQTRGPIRIYPTSTPSLLSKWYGLPCERSFDTHTQYIHTPGTSFITVLNRQLCIFLSAYIPQSGVGSCCNVTVCFFTNACQPLLNVTFAE